MTVYHLQKGRVELWVQYPRNDSQNPAATGDALKIDWLLTHWCNAPNVAKCAGRIACAPIASPIAAARSYPPPKSKNVIRDT
jgi:hypothetical protein